MIRKGGVKCSSMSFTADKMEDSTNTREAHIKRDGKTKNVKMGRHHGSPITVEHRGGEWGGHNAARAVKQLTRGRRNEGTSIIMQQGFGNGTGSSNRPAHALHRITLSLPPPCQPTRYFRLVHASPVRQLTLPTLFPQPRY